jgi:hypothetical protein
MKKKIKFQIKTYSYKKDRKNIWKFRKCFCKIIKISKRIKVNSIDMYQKVLSLVFLSDNGYPASKMAFLILMDIQYGYMILDFK